MRPQRQTSPLFFYKLKRQLSRLSIKRKIIITYILLILLPCAGIGSFFYGSYIRIIEEKSVKDTMQLNTQLNKTIDQYMMDADGITKLFMNNDQITEVLLKFPRDSDNAPDLFERRKIDAFITEAFRTKPNIQGVFVVTPNNIMFNQQKYGALKENYVEYVQDWRETLDKSGQDFILLPSHQPDILTYRHDLPHVVSFIRNLKDYNGISLGLICINLETKLLQDTLQDVKYTLRSEMIIGDSQGNLVYPSQDLLTERETFFYGGIMEKTGDAENGYLNVLVDKTDYFVSYSHSSFTNWRLIHIIPYHELLAESEKVKNKAILLFGLFFLLFLLGVIFFSRYLTKPLVVLSRSMRQADAGNLKVQVKVHTEDEVGALGESFNAMIRNLDRTIRENYELRILKMEAELSALQDQLNPHFLYNTLDMIGMTAVMNGDYQASEMMSMLGEMLRYTVHNDQWIVPAKAEIDYIRNYVKLQSHRLNDVEFVFELAEATLAHKILKLSIQPLIENCIVHGFRGGRKGVVSIHSILHKDRISFVIEDNGIGMNTQELETVRKRLHESRSEDRSSGIGLYKTNKRIKMAFGEPYGIQIRSTQGKGTTVEVTFPLNGS
ncbi:cache domain-containing sensor histidine kinase [Cohnella herbarum]|uniref:histidine kinase n=1 Tax=Cohnella herbarum TaxID=2728023 RepID=A0A7Z2VM97_9BACL|nr:sensor histidine kinase [Cohnella herbarum]QJD85659.1 histidine kinase [Cohnella herbarum]